MNTENEMKWNLVVTVITDLHVDVDVIGGSSRGRGTDRASDLRLLSAYNSVKKKEGKTRVHQQADLVEMFPKCIDLRQNSSIQPSYDPSKSGLCF